MANKKRIQVQKHLGLSRSNMGQRCKRGTWDYMEVLKIAEEIQPPLTVDEVAEALGITEIFTRWKNERCNK